ncbi:MAG: type IV pilus twitching motility protein PilT [bacterium]|nr:type IV pilus twitching motility protein PilT [bacterium]
MYITELLEKMVEFGASDIHLKTGSSPILRVNGELTLIGGWREGKLTPSQTSELAFSMMNELQRHQFEEKHELDMAYSVSGLGRFRANIFMQRGSIGLVLRMIPFQVPSFKELNLPPVVLKKLAEERRGLVMVVGPTGCGKSTTLAAIVDYINSTRKCHIMTIEDPIEYLHRDKESMINQREIGIDTDSFADALRHIVRQDPDVILIGEMRDAETLTAALSAAETGHLVLTTLHTIDAPQTVKRMINLAPPYLHNQIQMQLSLTLQGIVSLRLLPRIDTEGRVPAVEVMIATAFVKKLLEENKIAEIGDAVAKGRHYGMQTFNQAIINLYREKKISYEDAMAAASNPEELKLNLSGIFAGQESVHDVGSEVIAKEEAQQREEIRRRLESIKAARK